MQYNFNPNFKVVATIPGVATIEDLSKEQGVYSATPQFVKKNCGDIARSLLALVPYTYYDEAEDLGLFVNCDVRIHRLYPGDFPAYPGWHCDGEYRETYFSQPDMNRVRVHNHLIATISSHEGGVSNTQFLAEPFSADIESVDSEHTLWGQINCQLEKKQQKTTFDTKDGQLMMFDSWTLHRAMPARIRGWRLFFRVSMWHKPNLGDGGKISHQEQVYKLSEGGSW